MFHNLKSYDSYLFMQEQGKFNLQMNAIPNGLEKCMRLSMNNKLSFIDTIQFLNSSLNNLVKTLSKDDVKYLSQEFENNVLEPIK